KLFEMVKAAQETGFDITREWLSEKSGIPLPQDSQHILMPPKNTAPETAALSLAALSSSVQAQSSLDTIPHLLAAQASTAADTLLQPLIEQVKTARTPEAVYDLLAASYTTLNENALRELVGRAILVAEVSGEYHA
ncbi:DUF935 family protein, partial [Salmonella enterica subsp. enterica serovar Minnesota]